VDIVFGTDDDTATAALVDAVDCGFHILVDDLPEAMIGLDHNIGVGAGAWLLLAFCSQGAHDLRHLAHS
jgi:hypothetical protein